MLSNGYSSVQRARLVNFDLARYFTTVVISDEVGVAKPDKRFFDLALGETGDPAPGSVLMVGDNLRSDIGGGAAAGLATCWYNPGGATADDTGAITFEVNHLSQIEPLVR
ncbi:MAG: HAD-IA family hydrolase [Acidimicrobiales bacterium]